MALSNVTTSTSGLNSADTAVSFTHTVTGTPRGIIVMCVSDNDAIPWTSVTYGGTSLSEVTSSPSNKTTGEDSSVSIWFLGTNTTLSGNQTVIANRGFATEGLVCCVTVNADDDVAEVDTTVLTGDTQASPVNLTLSLGGNTCLCVCAGHSGRPAAGNMTALTDWTEIDNVSMTSESGACYVYDNIQSSDVTAGWTMDATDDVNAFALAVRDTFAGGGISVPVAVHHLKNQGIS